jgi:hypothetical protein
MTLLLIVRHVLLADTTPKQDKPLAFCVLLEDTNQEQDIPFVLNVLLELRCLIKVKDIVTNAKKDIILIMWVALFVLLVLTILLQGSKRVQNVLPDIMPTRKVLCHVPSVLQGMSLVLELLVVEDVLKEHIPILFTPVLLVLQVNTVIWGQVIHLVWVVHMVKLLYLDRFLVEHVLQVLLHVLVSVHVEHVLQVIILLLVLVSVFVVLLVNILRSPRLLVVTIVNQLLMLFLAHPLVLNVQLGIINTIGLKALVILALLVLINLTLAWQDVIGVLLDDMLLNAVWLHVFHAPMVNMVVLVEHNVLLVLLVVILPILRGHIIVLPVKLVIFKTIMRSLLVRNVLPDGFQKPECLLVPNVRLVHMPLMVLFVPLVQQVNILQHLVDLLV